MKKSKFNFKALDKKLNKYKEKNSRFFLDLLNYPKKYVII